MGYPRSLSLPHARPTFPKLRLSMGMLENSKGDGLLQAQLQCDINVNTQIVYLFFTHDKLSFAQLIVFDVFYNYGIGARFLDKRSLFRRSKIKIAR